MKENLRLKDQYILKVFNFIASFVTALILSMHLTKRYEIGGGIFIVLQVIYLYKSLIKESNRQLLPKAYYRYGILLIILTVIESAFIFIIIPWTYHIRNVIQLASYLILLFTYEVLVSSKYFIKRKMLFIVLGIIAIGAWMIWLSELQISILMAIVFIALTSLSFYSKGQLETVVKLDQSKIDKIKKVLEINVYRMFLKTISNVIIAVMVIFVTSVSYMTYFTDPDFYRAILLLGGFFICIGIVVFIVNLIYKKLSLQDIDANLIIMIGSILMVFSNYILYNSQKRALGLVEVVCILQGLVGISFIFSGIIQLSSDIREVIFFATDDIEDEIINYCYRIVLKFSIIVGFSIILVVFTYLGWVNKQQFDFSNFTWGKVNMMKISLTVIPGVFFMQALISSLRQPFTKEYVKKLEKYKYMKLKGENVTLLAKRLNKVLIRKYTRRYGIKIVAMILKPFCFHKVKNKDKVDLNKGPGVFVCNHGNIYGPIVANLYVPFYFRPWVIGHLFDVNTFKEKVYNETIVHQKWLPDFLKWPVCNMLAPIVVWAMHSLDAIPVYREGGKKILKTFKDSVLALKMQDNILLFPENPMNTDGYISNDVGEMFTGFAHMGKQYYKETKKCLYFYPIYASKKKRTISFADPIVYNPKENSKKEKERIASEIFNSMKEMANSL